MKRSAALTPLSHDHQHALDAAYWLRRAEPETVADAVARFRRFFETEGRRHFAIEEEFVLPALPAPDADWEAGVARVLREHAAIRAQAQTLAGDDVDAARALGQLLNAHVRFEERELFGQLERRLDEPALRLLGEAIAAAERS